MTLHGLPMSRRALLRLWRVLLVLALALPAGLFGDGPRPALAAAGDLDPSFDGDGRVVTLFGNGDFSRAHAMVIQPDSKIVAAGWVSFDPTITIRAFALTRYNPDGSLDSSFGVGGRVATGFDGATRPVAHAVALQADGKIVAAGATDDLTAGSGGVFALARYKPDGSLDTSFGNGGKVLTPISGTGLANAVVIQADGKIIAAGSTSPPGVVSSFALARYKPDGSLDSSFGVGGTVVGSFNQSFAEFAQITDLALQPDGKILAAGRRAQGVFPSDFVVRFNADGSRDMGFGLDGLASAALGFVDNVSIARQADGKIVAAAGGFALARYNPNGSLDDTFGTGGRVTIGGGIARAVAIQANGKIVVAGATVDGDFLAARYNPDGSLDNTFGTAGRVTTDFLVPSCTLCDDGANAVAIQADGKIVAAGAAASHFALARYLGQGTIGGKGFGITPQTTGIKLDWTGGTDQLAYLLARSPTVSGVLPAASTTYTDESPAPAPTLNCYVLFPLGASGPLGQSDFLCAQLGLRSASGVPGNFTLRLNQSATASLSWTAPGGQFGYALLALPLDGSPPRTPQFALGTTSATDATGGVATCYMLFAGFSAGPSNTNLACGVPGTAQFSVTAAQTATARTGADPTTAATDTKRAQATAERLFKRQAAQLMKGPAQKLEQKLRDGMKEAKQQLEQQSDQAPTRKSSRGDDPVVTPTSTPTLMPSPTPTVPGTPGSTDERRARP